VLYHLSYASSPVCFLFSIFKIWIHIFHQTLMLFLIWIHIFHHYI
jgi:hypothetical protein